MKGMTASMKKITWCVIYRIKVNYTSYNYTSYKCSWTSLIPVMQLSCLRLKFKKKLAVGS